MVCQFSVLDKGGASNLINSERVPPGLLAHIRYGPALDIAEANINPLKTVGYVPIVVRMGTCIVQLDFFVCHKVTAPVTLGCEFCLRHIEANQPRAKAVEMANGSNVSVLHEPLKLATQKGVPIPAAQ